MPNEAKFTINKSLGEKCLVICESAAFDASTTIVDDKATLLLGGATDDRILWKATIVSISGNKIVVLLKTVVTDVPPFPASDTLTATSTIESGGVSITFQTGVGQLPFVTPTVPFVTYEGV